jgi:hypothetical protein
MRRLRRDFSQHLQTNRVTLAERWPVQDAVKRPQTPSVSLREILVPGPAE